MLPVLAPLHPLPIPQPVFVGRASPAFPWPFFGGPLVPGRELAEARLDDDGRAALTRRSGGSCARSTRPRSRSSSPSIRSRARTCAYACHGRASGWPSSAALQGPTTCLPPESSCRRPERLTLVPDLHLRHAFVENGQLSGVIDWGDVRQCRSGRRPRPRLVHAAAGRAARVLRRVRASAGVGAGARASALALPLHRPRAARAVKGSSWSSARRSAGSTGRSSRDAMTTACR